MLFDITKDFKDCKYDVFAVPLNILDSVPEMRDYKVLMSVSGTGSKNTLEMDRMIRYAVALYDKKSPLIKTFSAVDQRRAEAAVVAGYSPTKDGDTLRTFYEFTDIDLQLFVMEFMKDQNDMWFSLLVSNEQTFYEYNKALQTPIGNVRDDKQKMDALNVKSKLMDECDKIATRVEGYYLKVFGDGEVRDKAKTLRNFSPESIAHRKNV